MANPPRRDAGRRGHEGSRPRDGHRHRNRQRNDSEMTELCRKIALVPREGGALAPDLFDGTAEEAAKIVADEKTKPTQLRRFYDELLHWDEMVNGGGRECAGDRLREQLPFIRMMNAKAAYANGRNLVGASFAELLRTCLAQVDDNPQALRHCRLFFEAFMGFYKRHGPRD